MSLAYQRNKKEKLRIKNLEAVKEGTLTLEGIVETARIRSLIKKGDLPKFHLAKDSDGKVERDSKGKRTWRQVSTLAVLTKK